MKTPTLSKYPVLENRPIDQWKVTELKKELKRRRLKTAGLKVDLIKRLDEALRAEMEEAVATNVEVDDNSVIHHTPVNISELHSFEAGNCETVGFGFAKEITGLGDGRDATKESEEIADSDGVQLEVDVKSSGEHLGKDDEIIEGQKLRLLSDPIHEVGIDTTTDVKAPSEIVSNETSKGFLSENTAGEKVLLDGKPGYPKDITPSCVDVKLDSSAQMNQVFEVSSSLGLPVKSVTSDSMSFMKKNDLEDKLVTDNVKLDSYVKPESMEPSSSGLAPDGGESNENMVSVEETFNTVVNANMSQNNSSVDLGSEKLNLDRSSGDDFMEEDALESNQVDSSYTYEDVGDKTEKNEVTPIKAESLVAITKYTDLPAEAEIVHDQKNDLTTLSDKRKLSDDVAVLNKKPAKRQHPWKTESNNVPLSDREVPPSMNPATNSLRIDHFLRPFTLKAVQELLSKTGTVVNFWMDHIKTHCYVTYTSVQEAVETRNTVYNLQWPPTCGHQLTAEFVDPEEVKLRLVCLDPPSPLPFEKVDAPILMLDDLFRKTKAMPQIYYLPLSDEQVTALRKTS